MNKILMSIIFIIFFVVSSSKGIELGIGYTADVGAHLRINRFELQGLFDKDFVAFGLRYYPFLKSINIMRQDFVLYIGGEGNYVISELLDWGYSVGVFSGLDKRLYKNLHLGIDLGIFICTLKAEEDFTDWGLSINTKLTYKLLK